MEAHRKRHGERLDREERLCVASGLPCVAYRIGVSLTIKRTDPGPPHHNHTETRRKKEAREAHRRSKFAQKVHGLRAKLYNAKRYKEKAQMRKT